MCVECALKCKANFPRKKLGEKERENRLHSPKNSPVCLRGNYRVQ